jgi:hypothetical protein
MDAQAVNALASTNYNKASIRGMKALKLQKEQEQAIAGLVTDAAQRGEAAADAQVAQAQSDGVRGTKLDITV